MGAGPSPLVVGDRKGQDRHRGGRHRMRSTRPAGSDAARPVRPPAGPVAVHDGPRPPPPPVAAAAIDGWVVARLGQPVIGVGWRRRRTPPTARDRRGGGGGFRRRSDYVYSPSEISGVHISRHSCRARRRDNSEKARVQVSAGFQGGGSTRRELSVLSSPLGRSLLTYAHRH